MHAFFLLTASLMPAAEPARPIDFDTEVMPILTRAGCNAGACHGYSLGKNGFKLSLRGPDPALDYFAIVKDSAGRRVNFQVPQSSLLVAKARGETAHEGGARFARGSLSDTIFTNWITQGAPSDVKDTREVVRVMLPSPARCRWPQPRLRPCSAAEPASAGSAAAPAAAARKTPARVPRRSCSTT